MAIRVIRKLELVKEEEPIVEKKPTKQLLIRSQFVAPKDHVFIEIDLSQAEAWIVAFLAGEVNMKNSLANSDIHTDTANVIFSTKEITKTQRYLGKKANHSLNYRSTHYMLATSINAESDRPPYVTVSIPEAKNIYTKWHGFYNIRDWWTDIEEQLRRTRTLVTPYDRVRMFFENWGDELFKQATAHIPQSTVADHLNGAVQKETGITGGLLEVSREFVQKKQVIKIVNQSHDSFIAECHKSIYTDIAPQLMKLIHRPIIIGGEECLIPVDCKVGDRWGELEELKA